MIDLSSLKTPGWQRVVAELSSPAQDDRAYLERLLTIVGQVSAAKQATLMLPASATGSGEMQTRLIALWPVPPGSDPKAPNPDAIEQVKDIRQAARLTLESAQSRAFGLDDSPVVSQGLYDGGTSTRGYVLAIPLLGDNGRAVACITMLLEPRSKPAVQSTLAMAEVLCGYINVHAGRQEIKRMHQAGMSLELATRLIGAINAAPNFKGGVLRLVNDLTRQFGADRAALGWVRDTSVEVVAISDAEDFDKRMKMVRQLREAMDECLDQEQAVLFPAPTEQQDLLLAQAIVSSHRELVAGDSLLTVCSVPVRSGDETLGVLTVELKRKDNTGGLDLRGVEILQAAMDLVAPVLAVKKSDSQSLPRRAVSDSKKAAAWLVGPKHTVWKLAGVLAIGLFLFLALFKIEYRISAPATLEPRERRTIAAPFEGIIAELGPGIEPGRAVKAGDTIAVMDTRELLLQRESAFAKIHQAEKQIAAARRDTKVSDAQLAQAALDKAIAELALIENRLRLSRLTAPIDGTIIAGDLKDKIGTSVKAGDDLFQVAPLDNLLAVARVDERDIGLIQTGGLGRLATKANPADPFDLTIETIIPSAVAHEGRNQFEVRAALAQPAPWMRPGMEAVVNLNTGKRSLLAIGTRRVIDAVRLWWW